MFQETDISIVGCGWLGLPLAEHFLSKGYHVKGSTTTPGKLDALKEKGIEPHLLDLSCNYCSNAMANFMETDVLVVCFPPNLRKNTPESYLNQLRQLISAASDSPVSRVIFISSTAVYDDLNRVVTEEDAVSEADNLANTYLAAENLFQNNVNWLTTVLRFGGLVNNERHPGRFLAGKNEVSNPDSSVNIIHLEDCIEIISQVIQQSAWNQTFNAVADKHPSRKEFYTAAAEKLGLIPPAFTHQEKQHFKIISNKKLKYTLSYEFRFPDPMLMI